jgi:hypothetical protein
MEFEWDRKISVVLVSSSAHRMWLAQFVCVPQFFKTASALCGHTVWLSGDNGI